MLRPQPTASRCSLALAALLLPALACGDTPPAESTGTGDSAATDATTGSGATTEDVVPTTGEPTSGDPSSSDGSSDGSSSSSGGEPAGCDASSPYYVEPYFDPTPPAPDELLWSSHGGWALWDFCQCKPDDTVLPEDPRAMVQPGVSDGRAVAFNAFWKDCHVDPELVKEVGAAKTCGELRERARRGSALLTPSSIGAGALFSGTEPQDISAGFGIATFPATQYNKLWQIWGFQSRPDNFDELVSQRYGAPFGSTPNPYPLPGEDPNLTDGGSGRLPQFFTHLREPDGTWTGKISITCQGCHSGSIGTADDGPGLGLMLGSGSPLADHNLFLRDMLPLGYLASAATIANLNRTRGVNNASDVNLAFLFPDEEGYDLQTLWGVLTSGSTAGMNTPSWWNMGHRALKFVDGTFPMDAPRVDMVFYTPFFGLFGGILGQLSESGQDWMRQHAPDANDWIVTLKAPNYPFAIDEGLAGIGAVYFHTLDLWAPERQNPIKNPKAGNGSCSSCHGAYAPRYFNDPAWLARPELEGVASYITPLDVIGTDPVRMETNNEAVQVAGAKNFFGYPETAGTDQDCGPQNRADLRGDRELGYLAPPLHGVWATAPYLHNGSVPNVWEILKPSERKNIWLRLSTPPRPDQAGDVVMGYDTSLTAYDAEKVGWYYQEIPCEAGVGVTPYINCTPGSDNDPLAQLLLSTLYSNFIGVWNILYPPILTEKQMEARKIYNTHMHGQGNEGHEFTAVLTDDERLAIIEYLKTL